MADRRVSSSVEAAPFIGRKSGQNHANELKRNNKQTPLHYLRSGRDGELEDWWYLVARDDGTLFVWHRWHHRDFLK